MRGICHIGKSLQFKTSFSSSFLPFVHRASDGTESGFSFALIPTAMYTDGHSLRAVKNDAPVRCFGRRSVAGGSLISYVLYAGAGLGQRAGKA